MHYFLTTSHTKKNYLCILWPPIFKKKNYHKNLPYTRVYTVLRLATDSLISRLSNSFKFVEKLLNADLSNSTGVYNTWNLTQNIIIIIFIIIIFIIIIIIIIIIFIIIIISDNELFNSVISVEYHGMSNYSKSIQ